ncbi:MFS transporter [Streptomyces gilvosporeus]|uniref:MFS transporter n=1 Tax=Streptomyces gilvosporeus TaxID=553510 RepID=A0A1V0U189_9ACTN|nr:MFS transporter [Streptomyces gilvosporeus]ARF58702.1 MFS transporter [Streptomyces gilvosporeus]
MYLSSSRAADASAGVVRDRPGIRRAVAGTVVALGLVSMVTDVSSEMVTAVLPLYLVAGLGMTPLAYGLLDGVYQGVTALVRLAGSYAADRTHRRKLVAGSGYALSAVCKLGLLAVTTPWAIGAVLAADRTGKGLRSAPRDALISLSTAPEDQGRAFGVHRTLDTAGALLGPLAAFAVLWPARDAYDAVFQVSFCCAVFGVLLLALYVREPRAAQRPAHPPRPGLVRALRTLAGTPGVPRLSLAAVLLGAATISDAFLYLVLQQRHHLDARWFPLLPVGTAAAFLLLALPVGRLADRVGRLRVFLAGHGALLAAYFLLLLPLGSDTQLPAIAALFVLLGIFYAATDGVLMAAAAPLLPPALRASGLALVQTGQAVGRFAAAVLFGAAWTALGPATALAAAAAVLAAALALCLPVLLRDRPSATGKAVV